MRWSLAALVLSTACGGSDPGPSGAAGAGGGGPPPGPCRLELAARNVPGELVTLEGEPEVAVYTGFQGFVYTLLVVRVQDASPPSAVVRITTSIEGGPENSGRASSELLAPEGELVATPELMVFFNSVPYADLIGKHVRFRADVSSRTAACTADATAVLEPGP